MSDLGVNASLLIAGLDLSLVRMIRQAMQPANVPGGLANGSNHAAPVRSSGSASRQTALAAGSAYHAQQPAATYETRKLNHLNPRINELQPYPCTRPVLPAHFASPIEPPWKVLPWPKVCNSYPRHRTIKVQVNCTDVSNVGRTLDLFV